MEPLHIGDGSPSAPNDSALPQAPSETRPIDTQDAARAAILQSIAGLPTARLRLLFLRLRFLDELSPEDVACIVKSYRPRASDSTVAGLAGVDRRSLYRWPRFMDIKQSVRRLSRFGYRSGKGAFDGWEEDDRE